MRVHDRVKSVVAANGVEIGDEGTVIAIMGTGPDVKFVDVELDRFPHDYYTFERRQLDYVEAPSD